MRLSQHKLQCVCVCARAPMKQHVTSATVWLTKTPAVLCGTEVKLSARTHSALALLKNTEYQSYPLSVFYCSAQRERPACQDRAG